MHCQVRLRTDNLLKVIDWLQPSSHGSLETSGRLRGQLRGLPRETPAGRGLWLGERHLEGVPEDLPLCRREALEDQGGIYRPRLVHLPDDDLLHLAGVPPQNVRVDLRIMLPR